MNKEFVTKKDRGGETVRERKARLQDEGLWGRFVMERGELMASGKSKKESEKILTARFGPDSTALDRKDYLVINGIAIRARGDYEIGNKLNEEKKDIEKPVEPEANASREIIELPTIPKDYEPPKPSDRYRDRLPNGCPLFDPNDFPKAETDLFVNATWTESNIARLDIDETNVHEHCPSLSCAAYWWSARYTKEGYDRHRNAMEKLTVSDKSNLKRSNLREDDGGVLEIADRILDKINSSMDDGEE